MIDNTFSSYGGFRENSNQRQRNTLEQQRPQPQIQKQSAMSRAIDMSNIVNSNEEVDDNRLVIGTNEKRKDLYIPESSRYLNSLVLGLKGTGKTSEVLPMFVSQDLKNKKAGATIIVTKKEMAYSLYALAKKNKRKVKLLKPSVSNEISNKLLWQTAYSYDYINEFIINYKNAIKKKEIVIIDMEILKYKSEGLRAVAMLLLQLQLDIQETDITQKTPHYLYIDDAQYYLPFLEHLLSFSDNYNLGITLFMQSRAQLIKNGKDYSSIIDNNVRTTLLLNSLSLEDINFYSERFYEHKNLSNFYNRKLNSFIYETLDNTNKRKCGIADFKLMSKDDREEMETKAKKHRTKLLKEKRHEREKQLLKMIQERQLAQSMEDEYDYETSYEDTNEPTSVNLEDFDDDNNTPTAKPINYDEYDEIGEPKPFDLDLIEEQEITIDDTAIEEYKEANKVILNQDNEEPAIVNKVISTKVKNEEIKEIIFNEEKETKRKVSSNIFNKLNADIDYCDDSFDFQFD